MAALISVNELCTHCVGIDECDGDVLAGYSVWMTLGDVFENLGGQSFLASYIFE